MFLKHFKQPEYSIRINHLFLIRGLITNVETNHFQNFQEYFMILSMTKGVKHVDEEMLIKQVSLRLLLRE